ncbi:hypothetical protein Dip510_001527 [Elusimicrobium posterum]
MDKELHTKQDEWSYTTTHGNARKRVKRGRQKAKRSLSKKMLKEDLDGLE